ncbi:MAG: hypothetical protein H6849_00920 [Alphaproteobacteria bacterium]|nr:MAG: hypothetical protein H6849_00920 [Alphaproteobacteria bacterium]
MARTALMIEAQQGSQGLQALNLNLSTRAVNMNTHPLPPVFARAVGADETAAMGAARAAVSGGEGTLMRATGGGGGPRPAAAASSARPAPATVATSGGGCGVGSAGVRSGGRPVAPTTAEGTVSRIERAVTGEGARPSVVPSETLTSARAGDLAATPASVAGRLPAKLFKKYGDRIDLGRMTVRVSQRRAAPLFKDPKTGYAIQRDRAVHSGSGAHGPSYWKLYDKELRCVATLDKQGRVFK